MIETLTALVVDDEALARARMCTLLADCRNPAMVVVGEAASAAQALETLARQVVDVVLLDIHMPGLDGRALAARLKLLPRAPAVVFVTAHAEHAVQAFELDALDYLTKPVRLARLELALQKVARWLQSRRPEADGVEQGFLTIQDRGRTERIPLAEVAYLKAELKYLTLRTVQRSYILDGSLSELEEKFGSLFLRVHRNALVARRLVRALEKYYDNEEGDGWAVRLQGVEEPLLVSRRQLPAVRELLTGGQ
ncbi:MAG: LytTR family DNA-binding domain-containing protein [Rhodoferax sp.]|nr:LytTR family DNA-binding domain-containing protein [Rhodoferax sp.]